MKLKAKNSQAFYSPIADSLGLGRSAHIPGPKKNKAMRALLRRLNREGKAWYEASEDQIAAIKALPSE